MRILIDTTYARRAPRSGTGVYLERLTAELARLGGIDLVEVANERRRPPAGGGPASARNLLVDLGWGLVELPRRARHAGVEVIHHPLPFHSYGAGIPQVVTVHDLAFERLPDRFDNGFRFYAHHAHRAAARAASAVICVSQSTADDVRSLWGVPAERIVVAQHGPGQEPTAERPAADRPTAERPAADRPPASRPAAEPGGPGHFLYVGDDEPRKNLPALLAAYARYRGYAGAEPLELVLAGSASASAAGVRLEPDPSPARLAELYAGAAALVHTSLYEGFGLTPLEAMSAGTPVIAARTAAVAEVCGTAVVYADPGDPEAFAAAMTEVAGSPARQRDLAQRGRRRAADFSWARSARAHRDAYSLALRA